MKVTNDLFWQSVYVVYRNLSNVFTYHFSSNTCNFEIGTVMLCAQDDSLVKESTPRDKTKFVTAEGILLPLSSELISCHYSYVRLRHTASSQSAGQVTTDRKTVSCY